MRNPFRWLIKLSKEEKLFWVPTLVGVGAAITFLGLSLIILWGLRTWAGWLDIVIGFGMVVVGVSWSRYLRKGPYISSPISSSTSMTEEGIDVVIHKNVQHEIIPDRKGPYFMGESLGFSVKLKNLSDQPCKETFVYQVQLPDTMFLTGQSVTKQLGPHEEMINSFDGHIFLAFIGIFRVVIITGVSEEPIIENERPIRKLEFQSLFAAYSRDRDGYDLQMKMVELTGKVSSFTNLLAFFTLVLILLTFTMICVNIYYMR